MKLPDSLGAALALARGRIPAAEARMLLGALTGASTAQIAAYPERELAPELALRFVDMLVRREQGEPVAYLLGQREFYGRCFRVSPAVLIPRPETELIVDRVLARGPRDAAIRILDLGTGSGALAVSLALELPAAQVTAVDLSPAALAVAQGEDMADPLRPQAMAAAQAPLHAGADGVPEAKLSSGQTSGLKSAP